MASKAPQLTSGALPFGKQIGLSTIAGPTYVTAQTLVQQVAFLLSDRLWSYSPETFDLDVSARQWAEEQEKNVYGYSPKVQSMDIRSGAGTAALGYIFSKDFDVKRRHIPQAVLASSSALNFLRQALDQLSLLYGVSNPFVAHVAASAYDGSKSGAFSWGAYLGDKNVQSVVASQEPALELLIRGRERCWCYAHNCWDPDM